MVKNPVLFETFARVDYARKVFNQIKKAKPAKFYFYSNKARDNHAEEIKNNEEIRSWVNEIDWPCELHTFFREEHVDVFTSLKGALNWAFDNEEQVIILEDDCVPSIAFFSFCDQLLEKYKENKSVWVISGNNYFEEYNPNGNDYLFSHYFPMFGWASWRDRWNKIKWGNPQVTEMIEYGVFDSYLSSKNERSFRKQRYKNVEKFVAETHCWDYAFLLTAISNNGLCIIPKNNLVSDIGMLGTHGTGKKRKITGCRDVLLADYYEINNDPPFVVRDFKYDRYYFKKRHADSILLYNRFFVFIKSFLKRLMANINKIWK